MYSKDMFIGIVLSSFNFYIDISVDESRKIGYKTRIFTNVYGSRQFIEGVKRSLGQNGIFLSHGISTYLTDTRKSVYCLTISKINQLSKLMSLIPVIPNRNSDLELVREAISLVEKKKHLTLKGLQRLIIIKEMKKHGIVEH